MAEAFRCQTENDTVNHNNEKIPVYNFRQAVLKSNLDTTAKLILMAIDNHFSTRTGSCYLTVATIAKEASCDRRTVFRKFKTLEEAGFLRIERRFKNNEQISSLYWRALPSQFYLSLKDECFRIGGDTESPPSDTESPPSDTESPRTSPLTSPLTSLKEKKYIKKDFQGEGKKGAQEEDSFKDFYAEYPNKKNPDNAKKAYIKARKEASHEEIMNGLKPYKAYCVKEKNWYNPQMPATWLNGGGWKNEYETSTELSCPTDTMTGREVKAERDKLGGWDSFFDKYPNFNPSEYGEAIKNLKSQWKQKRGQS